MLNAPQQSGLGREYTSQNKMVGSRTKTTKMKGETSRMKNDTKFKTNTTTENRMQYVTHNNQIATPKELISNEFNQRGQQYIESREQLQEKGKQNKQQQSNTIKASTSVLDSSQKSMMQSMDKSSGSDQKLSSSNMNDKSQSQSKLSETENSEEEQIHSKKKKKLDQALSEKELEANVYIDLAETPVQTFLFIPSKLYAQESGQAQQVMQQNKKYEQLLKEKLGNDNFTERAAQSFNYEPKQKGFQTFKIEKVDCGIQQSSYDIQDSYAKEDLKPNDLLQQEIQQAVDKELKEKLGNPYCLLPTEMASLVLHGKKDIQNQREFQDHQQRMEMKGKSNIIDRNSTNMMSNQQTNSYIERESSKQNNQSGSGITGGRTRQLTVQKTFMNKNNTQMKQEQLQQQLDIEQLEQQYLQEAIKVMESKPSEEETQALQNPCLGLAAKHMERILNQNTYHKQIIAYRNYPEVKIEKMENQEQNKRLGGIRNKISLQKQPNTKEEDKEKHKEQQQSLQYLFKFSCELTKDRTVSCADWNHMNHDLLACSYGEFDMNTKGNGILAFWTLKNPSYPERLIYTDSRVLTCKFSQSNPNLIAAGTMDGGVLIYDIRKNSSKPIAQNYDINDKTKSGKHNDAVWEVQWVKKGGKMDAGEDLVSISSDGQILEWSMKKGLEKTELMKLKRQSNSKENQDQGVNFRLAAGFSFDFIKNEPSMYLTCTEENSLHRCSKSYQEQYLDSYLGHQGPIYKVRCNPFWSDLFLTCSADWSAKLWNWREDTFINSFQSLDLQDEVMDIEWSPHCSTLFGTVCKDGRLELWDLTKNNMLDPFAFEKNDANNHYASKTCIKFCQGAPILVTGDVAGDTRVHRLYGYEECDPNIQQERLIKQLHPAGYTKGSKDNEQQQA